MDNFFVFIMCSGYTSYTSKIILEKWNFVSDFCSNVPVIPPSPFRCLLLPHVRRGSLVMASWVSAVSVSGKISTPTMIFSKCVGETVGDTQIDWCFPAWAYRLVIMNWHNPSIPTWGKPNCMYRGADRSLAQPGRKQAPKHVRDVRNFNNIEPWAVISFFFFAARQDAEGNSRHSDRNISLFPSWSG